MKTSHQELVVKSGLKAGQLVASSDLTCGQTDKSGLGSHDIEDLQKNFFILNQSKEKNDVLTKEDFKKARIGVVVVARMKSSRLKKKAILPIRGVSSVERCLQSCLRITNVDEVILTTSTLEEDAVLKDHTLGGRVKFLQGDPHDVISRFLDAAKLYHLDVIVRVTADCPLVSPEIVQALLKAHFANGADYTEPREFAVGTNSDVFNVEGLKRVIDYIGEGHETSYTGMFMSNNPHIFKTQVVDLPPDVVRNYRLTLDYQEDLDMFNALYKKLDEQNLEINLANVFSILDNDPALVTLNAHKTLVYKADPELVKRLKEVTTIDINQPKRTEKIVLP